jgi:hypothetical protein
MNSQPLNYHGTRRCQTGKSAVRRVREEYACWGRQHRQNRYFRIGIRDWECCMQRIAVSDIEIMRLRQTTWPSPEVAAQGDYRCTPRAAAEQSGLKPGLRDRVRSPPCAPIRNTVVRQATSCRGRTFALAPTIREALSVTTQAWDVTNVGVCVRHQRSARPGKLGRDELRVGGHRRNLNLLKVLFQEHPAFRSPLRCDIVNARSHGSGGLAFIQSK